MKKYNIFSFKFFVFEIIKSEVLIYLYRIFNLWNVFILWSYSDVVG